MESTGLKKERITFIADLFEEDSGLIRVEVELPGVPKEDIGLELCENEQEGDMFLTIAALKPQSEKEEYGGNRPLLPRVGTASDRMPA